MMMNKPVVSLQARCLISSKTRTNRDGARAGKMDEWDSTQPIMWRWSPRNGQRRMIEREKEELLNIVSI